ncbi:YjjG family noncanonical pyrimidine nucleotidase [Zhouia amylolytica]|uniref:5'-nucleotidase n=1 Tax=Zhouia amylolytica AD3 TaxID=1286632 RepID=W2UT86_9FLAO|nr:YjjG family noncanonical pyrimidine nucleotidase [Zhouia amylolytica]ETN96716.1 5'-nucleotidase [Zhouia amylolytica AD3]
MKDQVTDIFFDLDHTLWDFEKNSALTFNKILSEYGVAVSLDDFLASYRPINMKYWKLYREERIIKEKLRYGRLKETFDELDYKIDDDLIYILSDKYIQHLPGFNHLFKEAIPILDYLKPSYNLHIITNGFAEVQIGKLHNSKISDYFIHVINSESVGVKKPNPKIFEHALEMANVLASQAVMIGDNYEADVLGAKSVGMHTIHFNVHNDAVNDQDVKIANLLEIKHYL